jgi:NAD(P)H-hydrate epimerase
MGETPKGQFSSSARTRAECRAFDREASERFHVAGELLMENAGAAVARSALDLAARSAAAEVFIVCGTGNNGGDGFVAARHLWHSIGLRVVLVGERRRVGGEALANLRRLAALGVPIPELGSAEELTAASAGKLVWIDAIFGTGLDRPVDGLARRAIESMNASGAPVLAVDLPSGLDADSGEILGVAIRASRTVTFVAPKVGFSRGEGPRLVGAVEIVGIGVPVDPGAPS